MQRALSGTWRSWWSVLLQLRRTPRPRLTRERGPAVAMTPRARRPALSDASRAATQPERAAAAQGALRNSSNLNDEAANSERGGLPQRATAPAAVFEHDDSRKSAPARSALRRCLSGPRAPSGVKPRLRRRAMGRPSGRNLLPAQRHRAARRSCPRQHSQYLTANGSDGFVHARKARADRSTRRRAQADAWASYSDVEVRDFLVKERRGNDPIVKCRCQLLVGRRIRP